jgi:hypothetical protein
MPPAVTSCRRGQQNLRLSDYSRMDRVADFVFGVLTAPAHRSAQLPYPLSFDHGARLDRRHQK